MSDAPSLDGKHITDEDRRMLQYFWLERGDLTRWCGWEQALPHLEREHPDLVFAWRHYMLFKQTLTDIVKRLETGDEL